jgi:hypothetical protein
MIFDICNFPKETSIHVCFSSFCSNASGNVKSYFSQVGDIVDVFGVLTDRLNEKAANCILVSFLDVKDDVMFEVERFLEIEYLYRNVYFPNILTGQNDSISVDHTSCTRLVDQAHGNLAAKDISQRILSLLSTEKSGILLEAFYSKLSDLDRNSVEEQVSALTLEGLVYTNQGKLNLL